MTNKELKERQSWPLFKKIDHSLGVIDQFLSRTDAYVSFSGGKDSTVLLDLCRVIKPDIKAVFCNTGNEYPNIARFVRELQKTEGYNIEIIHPELNIPSIISQFGFPLVSKETSYKLWYIRNRPETKVAQVGLGEAGDSRFAVPIKYRYLINERYGCSHKCCEYLKKKPFRKYEKETGLMPILGTMAGESRLRTVQYIKQGGRNSFRSDGKRYTHSMPLSIWTDEDIWAYIKQRNLKICDLYEHGFERTGCMFCGFGMQFANDIRLRKLYEMYPKWYEKCMAYTNNGVTFREALRKLLATNGLELPDEETDKNNVSGHYFNSKVYLFGTTR